MGIIALLATWWAGIGVVIGLSRSRLFPGPQDSPQWAAAWAFGWPYLWVVEWCWR